MIRYKVSNLNAKTSSKDQGKLMKALKGVSGVEGATLYPTKSEFELRTAGNKLLKRDVIASAVSKAGFPLVEDKPKT